MFDELNQFASNADFRIASFDGSKLVLVGAFDLLHPVDAHTVEVAFTDVAYIKCSTSLTDPQFHAAGRTDEGTRFKIKTAEGAFEIIAESVSVDWIRRSDGSGGGKR